MSNTYNTITIINNEFTLVYHNPKSQTLKKFKTERERERDERSTGKERESERVAIVIGRWDTERDEQSDERSRLADLGKEEDVLSLKLLGLPF